MRSFSALLIALVATISCFSFSANSQSVLNPADPVITYDSTKPPTQPAWGQIGKWVRTVRMSWNTDAYKCYIYKGICFRLKFPKTYQPGVADGKKYPMLVFFHGLGEIAPITDNEFHLLWGAQMFSNAVDNGTFDGYVLFLQSQGFWGTSHYDAIKELIDYMVVNNKLDAFQVVDNGLSSGGQGTWECYFNYPTYIHAAMPMSSVAWYYGLKETVDKVKFTPIWNVHGGQDGSPSPYTAFYVNDSMQAAGANYRNTMYPPAGHDSWNYMWSEPDFWPFINRVYASNPWALYGRKDYCTPGSVADTIGLVAGYDEYQWRKDGILLSGATGNKIYVTQPGTYDARVRRGALWSEWSKTPVVIKVVNCPGAPAKIEAENYNDMLGVQTETTTDAGGGLNVGWQDTGDWMDYLVNLQSAGNYTLSLRVATQYGNAQVQIRRPDGTVLQTVTIPNTGGWQTWQTVVTQVALPAGEQRIRIFTSAANGGWNINWLQLQLAAATNQPPTVNAGTDKTITLPTSTVTLTGTASDADGSIATYAWTKVSGPAGSTFGSASSASTTVNGLVQGSYVFRLTVTDNQGATAFDDVAVTVNNSTPSNVIHIEAESYSTMSGIQTENTSDVGGGLNVGWQENNDWMDYSVNIPTAGTYPVSFRVATPNTGAQFQLRKADGTVLSTVTVPNTGWWQTWQTTTVNITLPAGQQTLRIYTTDAKGTGWNLNWWEITLNSVPGNQPPTVNAGVDQTITLPTSSVNLSGTASDPDGTIATYSWTRVSGPSTVTFSSASTASTNVSGLVQGVYVFRLTVTDNGGATASDDISVTVNAAANQTPTVNAGIDQTITLPASSVNLSGTASDADGTISTYAWSRVSGPSAVTFSSPNSASTTASGLVQGTYVLRLSVTDNGGASASDDVTITVNVATNQLPTVNAGADQTITLPTNSITLTGTASDADGSILTYAWTKISGPAGSTFGSASSVSTTVNGLVQGSYVFRLTVTDNQGASSSDDVAVTVNAAPVTIHIEAENYSSMFGIQTQATTDAGGGLNVTGQDDNDWLDYSVNVPAAGNYTVKFRVATAKTNNPQFQLRNANGTALASFTVASTGGSQAWVTKTATVTLPAGQQTLRVITTKAKGGNGWNFNWWEITNVTGGGITQFARNDVPLLSTTASVINVYPNPVQGNFKLTVNNDYTGPLNVRIINSNGVVVKTIPLQKAGIGMISYNLSIPGLKQGVYTIQASMSDWNATKQLIKQ